MYMKLIYTYTCMSVYMCVRTYIEGDGLNWQSAATVEWNKVHWFAYIPSGI